jgi:small subunit ribosomal protein S1
LKGKVVNIEDYGAFIEIYPGVEGLVHVSEMTWSQHLKAPSEYVKLSDEAEVKVLSISREERKLSLGIKQLTEDPWATIHDKYPKDSKCSATVKNITNFGLFVELEEGIDGLVHISDLSWTKKYNHPTEFAKVGDHIEVVVLDIDPENRRLSLGHKQIEEDPWDTYKDIFYVDSLHEGTIKKIEEKGAIIELPYSMESFCPIKQLLKEDESKPIIDEILNFKVIEFDRSNRKIIVSHSQYWKESQKVKEEEETVKKKKANDKTRKAISQVRASVKKSTLASELEILQELKDKMENEESAKPKPVQTPKQDIPAAKPKKAKAEKKEEATEEKAE